MTGMNRRFHLVLALAALVAAIGIACAGLGSPGPAADSTRAVANPPVATETAPSDASTPTMADSPQETIYEMLLGTIPDTPEARASVFINDYALVRQMFASITPLPGPGDNEEAVAQFNTWLPPLDDQRKKLMLLRLRRLATIQFSVHQTIETSMCNILLSTCETWTRVL